MKQAPYRTHPFTRDELIEHARFVHEGHKSIVSIAPAGKARENSQRLADKMGAIVAALENYPLAAVAEAAVSAVIGDLSERRGFDDLIHGEADFREVRKHLVTVVAQTLVIPPAPFAAVRQAPPPVETTELEFE